MKKLCVFALLLISACRHSEELIRSKVVLLKGVEHGYCSGVQVETPSHANYILTAAHCEALAKDGVILARDDQKRFIPRKIVEVSSETDLMLLEPIPNVPGLEIASEEPELKSELRAFSHGSAFETYKSSGEYVQDQTIEIYELIDSPEAEHQCTLKVKNAVKEIDLLIFKFKVCATRIETYVSTLHSVPGSSGGPVVDSEGNLVGIISAGDKNQFSYIVTLPSIQKFLEPY